jgi:hypothetical protein
MLYTNGNDVVRTNVLLLIPPEVEKLRTRFAKQSTTPHIYLEFMGEDSGINVDVDERDTFV